MSRNIPLLASLIPYSSAFLPSVYNVEGALNHLLYEPILSTLSITPNVVEIGSEVTTLDFSWSINRQPTTSINITLVGDISVTNYEDSVTLSNLDPISSNSNFTLTVVDSGYTTTSTALLMFKSYTYWGSTLSTETTLDNNQILNLDNKAFLNTKSGNFLFTGLSNNYIYICFPTNYGTPTFRVNGLIVTFEKTIIPNFVNESGFESSYSIYRSTNLLNGSLTVNVV